MSSYILFYFPDPHFPDVSPVSRHLLPLYVILSVFPSLLVQNVWSPSSWLVFICIFATSHHFIIDSCFGPAFWSTCLTSASGSYVTLTPDTKYQYGTWTWTHQGSLIHDAGRCNIKTCCQLKDFIHSVLWMSKLISFWHSCIFNLIEFNDLDVYCLYLSPAKQCRHYTTSS